MMGWYGGGMGWGTWLVMGLFWILLLAVILYLVVRLLPTGGSQPGGSQPGAAPAQESPEEILDRRYARGEIDTETYQSQRAALAQARGKR